MTNKVRWLVLAFVTFLALAGVGVYAQLQKGNYKAAALGQLAQGAANGTLSDSEYGVSSYPLYPPELEAGDGKAETEAYCSVCHGTRYISMQPPLPAATWDAEVTKMKKTFGATIPDEVAPKITRYLQEHYTPETRKR